MWRQLGNNDWIPLGQDAREDERSSKSFYCMLLGVVLNNCHKDFEMILPGTRPTPYLLYLRKGSSAKGQGDSIASPKWIN